METVPREEIRQRISRFQTELATNDLEGAFILFKMQIASTLPGPSNPRFCLYHQAVMPFLWFKRISRAHSLNLRSTM
jgi:hypothetical protein